MPRAVIGAGVTGGTTARALMDRGFDVTVFDKHRYAAMETYQYGPAWVSAGQCGPAWGQHVAM